MALPCGRHFIAARGFTADFKYFESKRFGLPDDIVGLRADIPKNDTQTTVIYYGIDELACIKLKDVQTFFPGIHHMRGTDASSERYLYYPPVREETGNVLSFEAPTGKCVTEATVNEFSQWGKHIKRAINKFASCLHDAGAAFCSNYPKATPQDFKLHEQLKAHMRESCGNLDAFYEREPQSGEEPREDVDYFNIPAYCPFPDKGTCVRG